MAAVLNIDIHVNDDGSLAIRKVSEEAKKAESSTQSLKKSTDGLSNSFGSLKSTLATVGIGALAVETVKTADSMKLLEARINLTSTSLDSYKSIQQDMTRIANENGIALQNVGNLYSKLATSLKPLGIQTSSVMTVTDAFSKSLLISGASTEEASSATLQFAQAMASGRLQGDEFRSMAENSPRFMKAMTDSLGKTSAEIRQMAEDGKLTTSVVGGALVDSMAKLREEARSMPMTVGKSFNELKNEATLTVEQFDKLTGINDTVAKGFQKITEKVVGLREELPKLSAEMTKWEKEHETGIYTLKLLGGAALDMSEKLGKTFIAIETVTAKKGMGNFLDLVGKIGESTGISTNEQILFNKEMEKQTAITEKNTKAKKEQAKAIEDEVDGYVAKQEFKNIVLPATEVKKQVDKALEEYALFYKAIGDNETYLSIKRYQEAEKYKNLNKEQINSIIKAESDKLSKVDKLTEEWAKRKKELGYEIAEAEQDVLAKPYIELEKKYNEDLEKYGKNKGAKALIDEAYYSKVDALNKKTIEDFNKKEEEKNKKAAEWQVKLFEANEKINDQIIAQREKMYGATSEAQIEAWYQNQLEWLGKLALEGKATSEELQALLDKINGLKELKLKEQTISFKLEKSFYDSFENGLTDSIEDAFNGDSLNLKKFFRSIGNSLTNTIASSMSGSIVNSLRGGTSLLGGLSALAVGSSVSASEISTIMNSGGTFDSASNTITTSGGSKIDVGESGSGTVKSAGSDLMSLANSVSSLKTAYTTLTGGLSSSVLGMFQSGASGLSSLGFAGAGSALGEFGVGFASPWATQAASAAVSQAGATAGLYGSGVGQVGGAQMAGGYASGALMGAGVGYGVGTLGDKLFGAQTKAGSLGAVGGTIGSVFGPIGMIAGAAIGSLIGGMFGTKKTKDTGFQFFQGVNSSDNLNTDMIKGYADWQKKSWFSNKKGTDYSNLTSAQLKQIEGLFDTYDYLLKQLGDSDKIWLAAGKYSGESFQAQITKNFITAFTDVNQNIDGTMYRTWVDYATSVNTTVMEAFTTAINSFITEKRGFEVWSLGSTTTEALGKKAQFAKEDLDNLTNSIGIVGVTAENYIEKYNEAIKNNFTPEAIKNWNSLGEAIMASSDAQKAYQESLAASNKAIDDSIATLANSFLTSYTSAMSEINTVALNLIGTISNLRSQTKSLSDQLNTYSSGGASIDYLISQYNSAKKAFMGNFDAKGNLLAGKDKSMQDTYGYLESIIGQLSGAGINEITRGALVSEVGTFDTLFKNNENALKVEVVSGNLSVTEMAKALNLSEQQITQLKNTNSFSQDQLNTLYSIATTGATDQTLTSINTWLKSLYEVQAEAKIANTTSMSQKTFEAGHTLGTQEKIDFAKATGLVIGSEPFSKAITQMQGFTTSSNSYSYLSGLLNSGETDIANTIREVGAKAPTSATTALSQINAGASAQWAQYDSLMAKDSALQDKINKANAVFSFWGGANQRRYISQDWYNQYGGWQWNNLGIGTYPNQYYYVAPDAWSKAQALYGQLVAQEQSINPIKPTIPRAGYKTGGYTGDYGVDEVAGVVHGQEYVLNAQTTKDLGINNNGGLFKEMVTELRALRQEVSDLKQINANHMRETTNGNNMLKRMSGGGVALSVKAVS